MDSKCCFQEVKSVIWLRSGHLMSFERLLSGPFFDWLRDRLSKSNNFWQSSNLAVQNGFISRGSSGLPQLFRVAELRGGPSTSFGVFATLSLYRYSLLCTYCTNSRPRFDSALNWDRAENCNCSCGEGCGGRAVAARRARRSRDTANVRNVCVSVHLLLIAHCICAPQCFPR